MQIKRVCSQSLEKGPAEYFTGSVRNDQLFDTPEPARVFIVNATFEPGARKNRLSAAGKWIYVGSGQI